MSQRQETIDRYKRNALAKREAEKAMEKDRPTVIELLNKDNYDGIDKSTRIDIKYNNEGFISFLADQGLTSEQVRLCYKRVIDQSAIDELIKKGVICYEDIPPELYTVKEIDVIKVK